MASNTGCMSADDREITRSTSAVAVCCSSSSFRSRMSRPISVSWVSLPIEDRVWVGLRRAVALATCGLPTCLLYRLPLCVASSPCPVPDKIS